MPSRYASEEEALRAELAEEEREHAKTLAVMEAACDRADVAEVDVRTLREALQSLVAVRVHEHSVSFDTAEHLQFVALDAIRNILSDPVGVGDLLKERLKKMGACDQ